MSSTRGVFGGVCGLGACEAGGELLDRLDCGRENLLYRGCDDLADERREFRDVSLALDIIKACFSFTLMFRREKYIHIC